MGTESVQHMEILLYIVFYFALGKKNKIVIIHLDIILNLADIR